MGRMERVIQFPLLTILTLARPSESPVKDSVEFDDLLRLPRPNLQKPYGDFSGPPFHSQRGHRWICQRKNRSQRGGAYQTMDGWQTRKRLARWLDEAGSTFELKSSIKFPHLLDGVDGLLARGLHGLDDPSWDRLPPTWIGKAMGCGLLGMLCQAAGKVQRSAGLQWTGHSSDATKSKSNGPCSSVNKGFHRSLLSSVSGAIFWRPKVNVETRNQTSIVSCCPYLLPRGTVLRRSGWGPRYFPRFL